MKTFHIDLIPGDGIGTEVITEGKRVLQFLAELHGGIMFRFREFEWGCEYYSRTGKMMPEDALSILADCDAILLGAVGFPGVPDHVSLRGLLLPIRQQFDQYINFRPIKMLEGFRSPLKIARPEEIDFVIVRENSEGEYCGTGYVRHENSEQEFVVQEAKFTRKGTTRVIRYAFEYAVRHQRKSVISATKSNALNYSMVFWDKIFNEVKQDYPQIEARSIHADAISGLFILKPQMFEVVVASNLFGDILTDLGSAMLGSIGISPSANLNPEGRFPSMFEPSHGSAPDIAGKGIANPVATIWSIVLMLEHLQLQESADLLMRSMRQTLKKGIVTPDLGGRYTTREVVDAMINLMDDTEMQR